MTLYYSPRYWTPAENRTLLLHWGRAGRAQIVQMVGRPDGIPRSWRAILSHARSLGLGKRRKPWTAKEEALLRKCLGVYSMREIAYLVKRTEYAVRMKARKLGLRGFERGGRRTA
jgi:hypothetical protein